VQDFPFCSQRRI